MRLFEFQAFFLGFSTAVVFRKLASNEAGAVPVNKRGLDAAIRVLVFTPEAEKKSSSICVHSGEFESCIVKVVGLLAQSAHASRRG